MEYMTTQEAADLWGYSENTIRKWCREGVLLVEVKAEKIRGRWIIPAKAQCPKPIRKKEHR